MRKVLIALMMLLSVTAAYYRSRVITGERKYLNKFAVLLRAHSNILPKGATINTVRQELDEMLPQVHTLITDASSKNNRQDARELEIAYYDKFVASADRPVAA